MGLPQNTPEPGRSKEPADKRSRFHLSRVQPFELIEVRQVTAEVLDRMNKLQPDAESRHKAWVAAEFQYPLRSLLIKAASNSTVFAFVSLVIIGGGFVTSGIAVAAGASKGSPAAWVVFATGLIVAMAGGIAQLFRLGTRSNERRALAVTLREEGWNFAYAEGEYTDPVDALQKFRGRVNEIQRRIADVASIESEAPPTTHAPGKESKAKGSGGSSDDPDKASIETGHSQAVPVTKSPAAGHD
jgi:hypothetical protein